VSGSPFVAGANPNSIAVDPSGKFAYVANSASSSVSAYTIDAGTGSLGAVAGSPFFTQFGALARAVAVDPLGRFVYVANEISGPPPPGVNNVLAYTINAGNGALTKVGAALPSGASPFSIAVDPGGKFVYVANSASNDVSGYSIDAVTGMLTSVGPAVATGTTPFSITVHPTGRFAYVANLGSNDVSAYSIDATTGVLAVMGPSLAAGASPR